jgi:DNA-binding transcriptional LysR family regulator
MISLHQLQTFLAVVRAGSVRGASDALVVSQPAVSAALAGLQREVGAPLLERNGRGVRVTSAGEQLAAYGRRVFALLDEMLVETRVAAGAHAAVVRLAVVTTAAEQLVPSLLAGFDGRADVQLHVANRDGVWDLVAHGEAELALAGRPPDPRFRSLAVRPNELVVVAGAETARSSVLAEATWLLREPGSGTRAATETLLEALGITPRSITIGSNDAIRACVRAGLGVSLLSRGMVARDLAEAALTELPTPQTPLRRDWHLVALSARPLTAASNRFLEHVLADGTFQRGE